MRHLRRCVCRERGERVARHQLERMTQALYHRGPDDEGYYMDDRVALGIRRLSIIDLQGGHQPITNEDRSAWLVFNGELYNFKEIRQELQRKGHSFSSDGDAEVVVHAYEEYGTQCVERFNGMFAFAIWDRDRQRLFLARDRIGIKPLFYFRSNRQLVFASELKALLLHPSVPRRIDLHALDLFLSLEYIPAPRTIFEGIRKLQAGYSLVLEGGRVKLERYWDIPNRERAASHAAYIEELDELMRSSVNLRLVSDVPLGAFLSGGIDSSSVVAYMSEDYGESIRTFSIGFREKGYNELSFARAVSNQFSTNHTEEVLSPNISDMAETLVVQFDEPFGDFSIFPTFLVSKLASNQVKVALSGDGGDELFGGYDTYFAQRLDRYYQRIPQVVRQRAMPQIVARLRPRPTKKGSVNKLKRFVEGARLPAGLEHTRWMIFIDEAEKDELLQPDFRAHLNGNRPLHLFKTHFEDSPSDSPLSRQQYVDIKTYLAESILTKVDRMSMATSLEVRVPLLDHRIVEFAVNLPSDLKVHGLERKVILRRLMSERLPKSVLRRPKQGFSSPLKLWLRGPLRPLMTDLLSDVRIRQCGYFRPECVDRWVSDHLAGRADHSHKLWALMVFELWHDEYMAPRK